MESMPLYESAAIRWLEHEVEKRHGVTPYTLMQRAAAAALVVCQRHFPAARRLHVVCGPGNNGGDGVELAHQAIKCGYEVRVITRFDPKTRRGAAADAWRAWLSAGRGVDAAVLSDVRHGDLVIDAMFGTGLNRPLDGVDAELLRSINAAPAPCLALDLPSGLDPDSGRAADVAVTALHTVSFIGEKLGLALADGPRLAGRIAVADLGIPPALLAEAAVRLRRVASGGGRWPLRRRRAHKGDHGRLVIVGSQPGMRGAGVLAGTAALRAGAGLVRLAMLGDTAGPMPRLAPELMVQTVNTADALAESIGWADVVVLGPGLGATPLAARSLDVVLAADCRRVLDADALNLLATAPRSVPHSVLTPHPGEAARLLGVSVDEVETDRIAAVTRLADRYGCTVVLKGAGTLVAESGVTPRIVGGGNPGLATGGSGDVLSGVMGAMLTGASSALDAALYAVGLHNAAADASAGGAERGLLPSDVIDQIRWCVN
ncbi:MAG: NAD(P)H-hydrate dehydratase [Pseudomonadota bacterium]